MNLTPQEKQDMLKAYLGQWFKIPGKIALEKIKKFSKDKDLLCKVSTFDQVREVITYYQVALGRQDFKVFLAYELVEIYLDHREDFHLFDIDNPVAYIIVGFGDMENKRILDIMIQLVSFRISKGVRTRIIYRPSQLDLTGKLSLFPFAQESLTESGTAGKDDYNL